MVPANGGSDADQARAELLGAFESPEGKRWCDRHLELELWRRETELHYGGEQEWERGRGRCVKLLREGDTNWSTVLSLIRFTLKLHRARLAARAAAAAATAESSSGESGTESETASTSDDASEADATVLPNGRFWTETPKIILCAIVRRHTLTRRCSVRRYLSV